MSSKSGAKRQAVAVVSQKARSDSPSLGVNGPAGSPSAMSTTSSNVEAFMGDRQARTIALMNVPDTINDSRLRVIAETYGRLVKIVLRPHHQGAILEYTDAHDAGRAALGLEGYEITAGRKFGVGTVPEMLRERAERKTDKIQVGKMKKDNSGPQQGNVQGTLQASAPIRRPGQPVGRRGRLGQKRGLGFAGSNGTDGRKKEGKETGYEDSTNASAPSQKSNDDFRQLLSKKG
jgi:squamous cell carcinoma antigen recognized by T-cells 3